MLTAAKCPAVILNPIANGTDPLTSERLLSQTPCTTNTKMKVINASTKTPCPTVMSLPNELVPKLPI